MADASASDFDEFVASRSSRLLRTAYLLTRDRGQAEDLLQTALGKACAAPGTGREGPAAPAHRARRGPAHPVGDRRLRPDRPDRRRDRQPLDGLPRPGRGTAAGEGGGRQAGPERLRFRLRVPDAGLRWAAACYGTSRWCTLSVDGRERLGSQCQRQPGLDAGVGGVSFDGGAAGLGVRPGSTVEVRVHLPAADRPRLLTWVADGVANGRSRVSLEVSPGGGARGTMRQENLSAAGGRSSGSGYVVQPGRSSDVVVAVPQGGTARTRLALVVSDQLE